MINAAVAGTSVFGGNFTPAVPAGQNMANAAGAISAAGIVLYGSGAAAGQQGTAGTESGLSGMGPAGTQGVADAAAGITGGGGEVSGASTGVGEGGTTALGEGLGGMSGEAQQAVDEAGNTIATTGFALIGNARSVGTGIGAAFGQGIASGILSWIGSIQAAAAEAVNKAEAAARAASDSASPSKLFMKVGRDMGAGLAMGVTKSQSDVSDAMRGLVGATALPVYSNPGIARAVMTPAGSRAQGGPIQIHSEFTVNGDVYGVDDLEAKFHELADVRDRRLSIALQRNRSVT